MRLTRPYFLSFLVAFLPVLASCRLGTTGDGFLTVPNAKLVFDGDGSLRLSAGVDAKGEARATVRNVGSGPATLVALVKGPDQPFVLDSRCDDTIPAGGDCEISVTFPGEKAGRYEGGIALAYDSWAAGAVNQVAAISIVLDVEEAGKGESASPGASAAPAGAGAPSAGGLAGGTGAGGLAGGASGGESAPGDAGSSGGTGASGTGASGTGAGGTGASGTGASGTGASGTGASGTGAGGNAPAGPKWIPPTVSPTPVVPIHPTAVPPTPTPVVYAPAPQHVSAPAAGASSPVVAPRPEPFPPSASCTVMIQPRDLTSDAFIYFREVLTRTVWLSDFDGWSYGDKTRIFFVVNLPTGGDALAVGTAGLGTDIMFSRNMRAARFRLQRLTPSPGWTNEFEIVEPFERHPFSLPPSEAVWVYQKFDYGTNYVALRSPQGTDHIALTAIEFWPFDPTYAADGTWHYCVPP